MAVLQVENLFKSYGKKQALQNVTCIFKKGVNSILGPNGAGKTTLMDIICGAIQSTSGGIILDGNDVHNMNETYRAKLSVLFQKQPFYPSYTAEEFLYFTGLLKGMRKNDIRYEIERVLDLVNLSGNRKNRIKGFSGGMKQRLAIAQTIMNNPEIIIFDEPSAGLDPKEREEFKKIMINLKKSSIIIISTHIVSDIDTISDAITLINKGEIVGQGDFSTLSKPINNMVWDIPKNEAEQLNTDMIYYEDSKIKSVSSCRPTKNAVMTECTLNDVYFYYIYLRGVKNFE